MDFRQRSWATLCCSSVSSSCLQLYPARLLLRKWLNIPNTESDLAPESDDEDQEDNDCAEDSETEGQLFLKSVCTQFYEI